MMLDKKANFRLNILFIIIILIITPVIIIAQEEAPIEKSPAVTISIPDNENSVDSPETTIENPVEIPIETNIETPVENENPLCETIENYSPLLNSTNLTLPLEIISNETEITSDLLNFKIRDSKNNAVSIKNYSFINSKLGIAEDNGKHNILLEFDTKIKSIQFNQLDMNGSLDLGLDIFDASKIDSRAVDAFAIDPSSMNFTNAILTATAIGNEIYKCKDWNFTEQICYGNWEKIMDIIPGEDYNLILTPNDPAYIQYNFSNYPYTNITGQKAFKTSNAGAQPPLNGPNFTGETEFNSTEYIALNNSDNIGVRTASDTNPGQRFLFQFSQSRTLITQINFSWIGNSSGGNAGKRTINLYAWNFTSNSWGLSLATGNSLAKYQLNVSINAGFNDYVNSSGSFIFSAIRATSPGTPGDFMFSDFVYLVLGYAIYPNASLVSPLNNATSSSNTSFICNSSSETSLSNITFYWNYSGSFISNGTTSVSGLFNETRFNRTGLIEGEILWNCLACDINNQCSFSNSNFTARIDTTPPFINLSSPINNSISLNSTNYFYFNATDILSPTLNCSLYLNSQLNKTNSSVLKDTLTSFNVSGMRPGNYLWNISCYDVAGNYNYSETRNIYVNRTPILTSINATPNPVKGGNTITINASGVDDPNSDSLQFFCSSISTPDSTNTNCTGGNTISSSPYSLSCSFASPNTNANTTIFCRVYDGESYSNVSNISFTTKTSVPTTSLYSVSDRTSPPYFDNINNGITNITVLGESGMSCRWSSSDVSYSSMANDCSTYSIYANCSVSDVASQGFFTRYISCADSLGNGQNSSQNLDIQFYLDYTSPTTNDSSDNSYHAPPYSVSIYEYDNIDGNPLTYYCTSQSEGCNPSILIDNGQTITYTNISRGTNYLRYYSIDFALNNQTIVNKTILINNLPIFSSISYTNGTVKGGSLINISTISRDNESQQIKLFVCKTNSVNSSGCTTSGYCNSTGLANLSCSFNSETDNSAHTWYAFIYDELNESANNSFSGSYTSDSNSPVLTVNAPQNISYYSTNLTFDITSNETLSSAYFILDESGINISMSNISLYNYIYDYNSISIGSHNISFYATDIVGNTGNSSIIFFSVEQLGYVTSPNIVFNNPLNNSYYPSLNLLINISSDQNLSSAFFKLNNQQLIALTNSSLTSWWNYTNLSEETRYNLTVYANNTNNLQGNKTISFYSDSLAPRHSQTSASPNPANQSQSVNCSVYWTDAFNLTSVIISENSTGLFENHTISLTQSGTASYLIPGSQLSIKGNYLCIFYATDIAGNTNSTSISFSVLDVISPIISVNSPSNTTYSTNTISLSISVNENISTAFYSLDGNANVSMSNTSALSWNATLSSLTNQQHNIIFYATDNSGNIGNSSIVYFVVDTTLTDTTPPVIIISSISNASYYNGNSLNLNITTDKNLSWAGYSLNGTDIINMTNTSTTNWNATFSISGETQYNLTVYANDTTSNKNQANKSIIFYVDTLAPRFYNINATPNSANVSQNVICNAYINDTFNLSSVKIGENSTGVFVNHTISLTSSGYANYTITNVQKGNYSCIFYATDIAGNTNSTSISFDVRDVTPPIITINSPLNQSYSSNPVLFSITLNENASSDSNSVLYSLDLGVTNVTLSGAGLIWSGNPSLVNSAYTVTFYAKDSSGNWGNNNISFNFDSSLLDTSAPIITIFSPINGTYYTNGTNITLNISSNKDLSWAGYTNNSGNLINLGNTSATKWNSSINLEEGIHNFSFYANDSTGNKNQANKSIYIYVDLTNPSINFSCSTPVYNTNNVSCSANVSDSIGLNYLILAHNGTGTWTNTTYSASNLKSYNTSLNISSSNITIPGFSTILYVYDLSGRVNSSSRDIIVNDIFPPYFTNIANNPNSSDLLIPGVSIIVNASITDNYLMNNASLMYKEINDASWNFVSMSNNSNSYNASFTPINGTWLYKLNASDSYGNYNVSDVYSLSVINKSVMNVSTNIVNVKSLILSQESDTTFLGDIIINNTGTTSLNITASVVSSISSRFNINYSYDDNASYSLSQSGLLNLSLVVNTTSLPAGVYSYTVNISSEAGSQSFDRTLNIQTALGPYLSVTVDSYPSSVLKGDTGIVLQASVRNLGTSDASSVYLNWSLPSGLTLVSGTLSRNIGYLPVGVSTSNIITISVDSSAADSYVNVTALSTGEGLTGTDSKQIRIGSPSTVTVTNTVTSSSGGGGGGSTGGGGAVSGVITYFNKIIEMLRGEQDIFYIDVYNNRTSNYYENLSLKIEGLLSQYYEISPSVISRINSKETGNFKVILKIPSYKYTEINILNATIKGKLVSLDGQNKKDYTEKQYIKLYIQEVPKNETIISLTQAELAIKLLSDKGLNIEQLQKLFDSAKYKLEIHNNKEADSLAKQVVELKNKALETERILNELKLALADPRKSVSGLAITGFAVNSVFSSKSVQDMIDLSMVAFERGDYELAYQRAKDAQALLILERKGNIALFLYLYWPYILVILIILAITLVYSYRYFRKVNTKKRIQDLNKEENNVRELMMQNQKNYFAGKISPHDYRKALAQFQIQLVKISKERQNLRNKRLKIFGEEKVLVELDSETRDIQKSIKELQIKFYTEKKISEKQYNIEFESLNERLAEIEEERVSLHLIEKKSKKNILNKLMGYKK